MQMLEDYQTCTQNYDLHRRDEDFYQDIESDVVEVGLRAEYAEYLSDKSNPPISFLDWCNEGHLINLTDEDKAQIEVAKAQRLKDMQKKLDNWAKKSAVVDAVINENALAAKSTYDEHFLKAFNQSSLGVL